MDTAISALFPPKARASIYLATAMLAAAYAVIAANVDLDWFWQAGYAAWNALAATVAASNTARTPAAPAATPEGN